MRITGPLLLLLGMTAILLAQTNVAPVTKAPVTSATGTNDPVREKTQIFAESSEISVRDKSVIYRGKVRVVDPQMTMTCELLSARMMTNSTKPSRIVAEENVVIDAVDAKGEKTHATAKKIVYLYEIIPGVTNGSVMVQTVTNESIEMTGNPEIKTAKEQFNGDHIFWDLVSGRIVAKNPRTQIDLGTNAVGPLLDKTGFNKK